MALVVKHEFVSGVADGADVTQIQPSNWNAAHTLSGSAAIAQVDGLQAALDAKVSSDSMSAALAAYVTSASLSTALGAYTTSASLATALAPYLTSASAALSTYVTSASLATALGPYLTSASAALSTYVTSASLATALGPYLTSASAALSTYVTSASLATALGPYLTSASAALGTYVTSLSLSTALSTYITSSSLATALGPYLTSASAALGTYLTSLSASTALALKQVGILFQDETVALSTTGAAAIVNFTGAGVSASLTGGLLTVTIPGGAGSGEGSVSISTMISTALGPYITSASVSAAIIPTVVTGITAFAGGGQASATQLDGLNSVQEVTIIASGGDSVKLPTPAAGARVFVFNRAGGSYLTVFPSSGHTIDQLAANTGTDLDLGRSVLFVGKSATAWHSLKDLLLASSNPSPLGNISPGTSGFAARINHVHPASFATTASFAGTARFLATVTFSATAAFMVRPNITTDGGVQYPFGGAALLGEISLGGARQSIRFSGSWTNICRFSLELTCKVTNSSATASFAIYSDGGTTPFLNGGSHTLSVSHCAISLEIFDSGAFKSMRSTKHTVVVAPAGFHTATANAAVINCIQVAAGASVTLSAGIAQLWGWYR